jgi:hypothetical protein
VRSSPRCSPIPTLVEAVAVVGTEPSGQQAIRAYVVPRRDAAEQSETLIGALRASVAEALPGYMHPASIVVLDTLPRTPNGKIDRARLPEPAARKRERASQPANEIERRVAKIWSSVLGLPEVDRTADFFELGRTLAARGAPAEQDRRRVRTAPEPRDALQGADHRGAGEDAARGRARVRLQARRPPAAERIASAAHCDPQHGRLLLPTCQAARPRSAAHGRCSSSIRR